MHEHAEPAVELDHQVLPAPADPLDRAPEGLVGPGRERLQRGELHQVEPLERGAREDLVEPFRERLDLRHLGHAVP